MKRLVGLVVVLGCASTAPPEPKPIAPAAPAPAPAAATPEPPRDQPPRADGDVSCAWLGGMQILVKRIPGAELFAAQLYIRGGVRNWGAKDAGVEQLALTTAASGGTETMAKDAFARRLSALGSWIYGGANDDYASIQAKGLTRSFDDTFAMLADVFLHPALPPAEIELQRRLQLASLRHELEYPDARLGLLVHQTLFKNHPYQNRSIGTLETVAALSREQLIAHLGGLRQRTRLVLVVVGDIDAAHVVERARAAFGALPAGDYHETALPAVRFDRAALSITEAKLPTNYIEATFSGPRWGDADLAVALVAAQVLHSRVWEEVRTKRNLSYAPAAYFDLNSEVPLGGLYVTAVDPNATMKVMFAEAARLKSEPVPAGDLAGAKSEYLTRWLMGNETTDGQARLLARAQLLGGDWHLARTLSDRVRQVTAADVQRFARTFMGRLQVVVLGDPARVDRGLFTSM